MNARDAILAAVKAGRRPEPAPARYALPALDHRRRGAVRRASAGDRGGRA